MVNWGNKQTWAKETNEGVNREALEWLLMEEGRNIETRSNDLKRRGVSDRTPGHYQSPTSTRKSPTSYHKTDQITVKFPHLIALLIWTRLVNLFNFFYFCDSPKQPRINTMQNTNRKSIFLIKKKFIYI